MAPDRITITEQIRAKLKADKGRTGVSARILMRGRRGEYPDGLRANMVDGWMSGRTATAKREHLDWVLQAWADYEPPPPPLDDRPEKLRLTETHLALLQSEVERTGLGAIDILRHAPKPLPEGLNHQKVQRWISGQTQTAVKSHWELVIRLYSAVEA